MAHLCDVQATLDKDACLATLVRKLLVPILEPFFKDGAHHPCLLVPCVCYRNIAAVAHAVRGLKLAGDKGSQFSAAIHVGSQENCDAAFVLLTPLTLLPVGVEILSWKRLPEQACLISVEGLLWLILCKNVGPLLFEPLLYALQNNVLTFSQDRLFDSVVTGFEML
ncbi:hypothetical protein ANAPC5_01462 [Anaplasma phagocytophilum]|nr:hypothetical protein ANAPC5_01462 [Anaplasma phagocytophilum]